MTPFLIAPRSGLSWIISRETLSGRSAEFDEPADEAQVARQDLGFIGDEDPLHIELHPPAAVGIEQVEGRRSRHEGRGRCIRGGPRPGSALSRQARRTAPARLR